MRNLKNDSITKLLLFFVVALLAANLLAKTKPIEAVGKFDDISVSGHSSGVFVFDRKSGDMWVYSGGSDSFPPRQPRYMGRLVEIGKPLVKNE